MSTLNLHMFSQLDKLFGASNPSPSPRADLIETVFRGQATVFVNGGLRRGRERNLLEARDARTRLSVTPGFASAGSRAVVVEDLLLNTPEDDYVNTRAER